MWCQNLSPPLLILLRLWPKPRIYAAYEADYPGFAKKALAAAQRAYAWAEAHPGAFYNQEKLTDPAVSTGGYGDDNANDEFFWAATELYLATGDKGYLKKAQETKPAVFTVPTWGNVAGLGVFAWVNPGEKLTGEAEQLSQQMESLLVSYADAPWPVQTPTHITLRMVIKRAISTGEASLREQEIRA